jgi:hypothetical protein
MRGLSTRVAAHHEKKHALLAPQGSLGARLSRRRQLFSDNKEEALREAVARSQAVAADVAFRCVTSQMREIGRLAKAAAGV